jgi:hypothetical protein
MPLNQNKFKINNFEYENAATNAIFTFDCVTVNSVIATDTTLFVTLTGENYYFGSRQTWKFTMVIKTDLHK